MTKFVVDDLPLAGLKRVRRIKLIDSRGFLSRIFCSVELAEIGWRKPIVQINHTLSLKPGIIRGLHYQMPPHSEMKLVSCLTGTIWDVVVDLRAGSPTFLKWHAEILSAENGIALLIPEGFAHGFQTMEQETNLVYLHSAAYVSGSEVGLRFDDPSLAISWPLPPSEISGRDQNHLYLSPDFSGIVNS